MVQGKIDTDDVSVLVESSRTPRRVVDGIATSMGRYNKPLFPGVEFVYPARRMTKNGTATLSKSDEQILNWTAASGSTVTNNGLVAPAAGQARIRVNLKLEAFRARTLVQILVNGVAIHQDATTGTSFNIDRSFYLNTNDVVTIRAWYEETSHWFWDTPYSRITSDSFVAFEDYPDQKIDFERDMVYGEEIGFWGDAWGMYVTPTYLKKGMPFATGIAIHSTASTSSGSATTTLSRGTVSGPILAQSRVPIPVIAGSKVNFTGTFRVRQTGTNEETESGSSTSVSVRFSLWGIGIAVDEYGVESIRPEELMMHTFTLQGSGVSTENMMEYIIAPGSLPDATIPDNVEGMYFTVSLVHDNGGVYGAGTYTSKTTQANGEEKPPKSASEMRYFGWSATDPLDIKIELPSNVQEVTEHPLSKTEVAFRDRKFFDGIDGEAEMVFFGLPGQTASVSVYNHDGTTRGSLIGTYSAAANERKVVTFTASTSRIELVSSGTYFVESVLNTEIRELYRVRNAVDDTSYVKINDDLAKISVILEEDGIGSVTLDFSSSQLDPATSQVLRLGKKIRVLGRHYGEGNPTRPSNWTGEALYTELFEGIIKKSVTNYDYSDDPIIQITAYNVGDKVENTPAGVAFDKIEKYAGYLTTLGTPVIANGRMWSGPVGSMPNKFLLNPAAHGDFKLKEGIIMTRNTNKAYFYVNAKNELIFTNEIEDSGIRFSDVLGDGDLGYGKMNRKADTETIVNQVVTQERLLDQENYKNRSLSADRPPEDLRYPETKSQNGTFTNVDSANEVGVFSKSFPVVRTFEGLDALYNGEIGGGFPEWAWDILNSHKDYTTQIRDFNVPVKNSEDIYYISKLGLMQQVEVAHKGDVSTTVVREINHVITPGKWMTKVGFESKGNRTFW